MVDHKAKYDLRNTKVVTPRSSGVVSKAVWESKMKFDQVKVCDEESESVKHNIGMVDKRNDGGTQVYKRMRPKQGLDGTSGKRKSWRSETSQEVFDTNTVQITRQDSELGTNMEEECRELSVCVEEMERSPVQISRQNSELSKNVNELSASFDGTKRSPVQIARRKSEWSKNSEQRPIELSVSAEEIKKSQSKIRKTRSELIRDLNVSVDGTERSPIRSMRTRAMSLKESKEPRDGMDKSSVKLTKVKSVSNKASGVGNESNAELRKTRSEINNASEVPGKSSEWISPQLVKFQSVSDELIDESSENATVDTPRRMSTEVSKSRIESDELVDESIKVLDESSVGIKKMSPTGITESNCEELIECEEKNMTTNLEIVSQIKSPPQPDMTDNEDDWDEELEEEYDEEIESDTIKEKHDLKEISIPEQKANDIVVEEKKIQPSKVRPTSISTKVKKQAPPVVHRPKIVSNPSKAKPIPVADEYQSVPKRHNKLQSLVDLVMWRDASKSAFIFGLGTFVIISSSYTTDLNISVISVVSYVGLIYLAVTFIFRSIIYRGVINEDETIQEYGYGVEEAMWLLKLILPYINEFLLKLRALFSGDPATTMKMAVLLFVLARCGSSITIWKLSKLGFFGVFTVPKICSSYSSQLTAIGTFWIHRMIDAWESCSHKKAVGFFIFTLIWNLSSVVARIWAVFMVFVAFKYYQQSLREEEDWIKDNVEEEISGRSSSSSSVVEEKNNNSIQRIRRQGRGPTLLPETKKQNKLP